MKLLRTTPLALIIAVLIGGTTAAHSPSKPDHSHRQQAMVAFAREFASKHNQPEKRIRAILDRAVFRPDIIQAMTRPAEKKAWHQYRPIFLTEKRIREGVEFWNTHRRVLEAVGAETGVPPEIITAIIGVETFYGRITGKHRVLDALTTLAFGYPRRAAFFRSELEHFLLLAEEEGIDVLNTTGSYAGAMGYGQFMPSSYRYYARDHDGDGSRDLLHSVPDAIASVANYFKEHGWRAGQPVAFPLQASPGARKFKAEKRPQKPQYSWRQLADWGYRLKPGTAVPQEFLGPNTRLSLVVLELPDGYEYWAALPNFYTITRYNHSPLYAMAVWQLAQAIAARHHTSTPGSLPENETAQLSEPLL